MLCLFVGSRCVYVVGAWMRLWFVSAVCGGVLRLVCRCVVGGVCLVLRLAAEWFLTFDDSCL